MGAHSSCAMPPPATIPRAGRQQYPVVVTISCPLELSSSHPRPARGYPHSLPGVAVLGWSSDEGEGKAGQQRKGSCKH